MSNSTHADEFKKAYPDAVLRDVHRRAADGRERGRVVGARLHPVRVDVRRIPRRAPTTSCAWRACPQVNIRLSGSHAGCEIGADGPSQMALEDIASLRAVHTSTVLYPSDAVSTAKLVAQMARPSGIVYMRTTRGAYPMLYDNDEEFPIGGSKVVRQQRQRHGDAHRRRRHPARTASTRPTGWPATGVACRVIDLYSVKPVDAGDAARGERCHRGPPRRRRGPLPGGRPRRRGAGGACAR